MSDFGWYQGEKVIFVFRKIKNRMKSNRKSDKCENNIDGNVRLKKAFFFNSFSTTATTLHYHMKIVRFSLAIRYEKSSQTIHQADDPHWSETFSTVYTDKIANNKIQIYTPTSRKPM